MIVRKTRLNWIKCVRLAAGVEHPRRAAQNVAEGITTYDLEVTAEKMIAEGGARPAFKGYASASGAKFPYVLCTSVNDEIVHGMPSQKRTLKMGDIVSIDTGVQLEGYYGDSAITVRWARFRKRPSA